MRRRLYLLAFALVCGINLSASGASSGRLRIDREPGAVLIRNADGNVLLRYQIERPIKNAPAVDSACYFHPFQTPAGIVVTDAAPADHPHHRGIFLGWVEMRGRKNADFWGWGEPAPKQDRRILSRNISGIWTRSDGAGFRARNEWQAEDDPLLREELRVELRVIPTAHVLDLVYRLTSDEELTLVRWAFGGFCVRTRKEGTVEAFGPNGLVTLPEPNHLKPETDWGALPWYDLTLQLTTNIVAGVAVLDHPKNPPTRWHNHRQTRILNPAVTAPGPLVLQARKPLVLRYRVVAHDGPVNRDLLNRLAKEWASRD